MKRLNSGDAAEWKVVFPQVFAARGAERKTSLVWGNFAIINGALKEYVKFAPRG